MGGRRKVMDNVGKKRDYKTREMGKRQKGVKIREMDEKNGNRRRKKTGEGTH